MSKMFSKPLPYGLNKINELRECHQRFGTKF